MIEVPAFKVPDKVLVQSYEETTAKLFDESTVDTLLQLLNHVEPLNHSKQLVVMLYTTNPTAGLLIELRCTVVIKGGKKP